MFNKNGEKEVPSWYLMLWKKETQNNDVITDSDQRRVRSFL